MNDDRPLAERINDNVRQHLDCSLLLRSTLGDERQALTTNDIEKLQRLTATKAAAAEMLSQLGRQLGRLRSEAGTGERLDALWSRAGVSAEVSDNWRQVLQLAAECQKANRENAALLDARHHQVQAAITVLDRSRTPRTYGRSGHSASAFGPRSLGTA